MPGWAAHGSQSHELPCDYVAVAEAVVAGNRVEPQLLELADGPLAGWLEGRLD